MLDADSSSTSDATVNPTHDGIRIASWWFKFETLGVWSRRDLYGGKRLHVVLFRTFRVSAATLDADAVARRGCGLIYGKRVSQSPRTNKIQLSFS